MAEPFNSFSDAYGQPSPRTVLPREEVYSPWDEDILDPFHKTTIKELPKTRHRRRKLAESSHEPKSLPSKHRSLERSSSRKGRDRHRKSLDKLRTLEEPPTTERVDSLMATQKIRFPVISPKSKNKAGLAANREENLTILYQNRQTSLKRHSPHGSRRPTREHSHFEVYKKTLIAARNFVMRCVKEERQVSSVMDLW